MMENDVLYDLVYPSRSINIVPSNQELLSTIPDFLYRVKKC